MKYLSRFFLIIALSVLVSGMTVFASQDVKVMGVNDQGKNPVIYIKGAEEIDAAKAVIGSVEASGVAVEKISGKDVSMKTFILIDNSLSIPEKNREVIKNVVSELIATRSNNEQFAVATFGEEIEILHEFSNDYVALKNTINNIESKDRETYLTDILYDLVNGDYLVGEEACYTRIFVVSDGVDNKSLGYTADELSELLEDNSIPVYTLGVYNKNKSNDEELKNMFALSRQTNADYFLLDEVEELMSIVSTLAEDQKIHSLVVKPDDKSKDGSEKTVQLDLQVAGETVTVKVDNVRMTQEAVQQETAPVVKEEPVVEPFIEPGEPEVPEEKGNNSLAIIMAVVVLAVIAIVAAIVNVLKKKKKEKEIVEVVDPFINTTTTMSGDATEFIGSGSFTDMNSDGTVLMFEDGKKVKITLTDVDSPARSFTTYIDSRIVIGRSASGTDICIDYDKSVSGKHCAIEKINDRFYLQDLQSSNKTYLNDNQVLSKVELCSGNIIKMGRVKMRVEMS